MLKKRASVILLSWFLQPSAFAELAARRSEVGSSSYLGLAKVNEISSYPSAPVAAYQRKSAVTNRSGQSSKLHLPMLHSHPKLNSGFIAAYFRTCFAKQIVLPSFLGSSCSQIVAASLSCFAVKRQFKHFKNPLLSTSPSHLQLACCQAYLWTRFS